MTVHRGRVTAVDTKGAYVRVAALGPDVIGPLEWLGSKPEANDGVLVVNAGSDSAPDLVVMLVAEFSRLCGGRLVATYTSGWTQLLASDNNIRIFAGLTQLTIVYGTASTGYIATNRQTEAAHPANALVTKGYVDAVKSGVKAIAAASSSFADFQTRMAAW